MSRISGGTLASALLPMTIGLMLGTIGQEAVTGETRFTFGIPDLAEGVSLVPVVVVLMTGRPLLLGDLPASAAALVEAWLPGSEAEGITDVLLGAADFTGKLPHSWPRTLAQVPINVGDAEYDPLFPYGFGLSYAGPGARAR